MKLTLEMCLISIPHTGTQFSLDVMKNARPRFHDVGLMAVPNPTPTLFHGHCVKTGQTDRSIELSKRMPMIMPMRHPYRVEASWLARLGWHHGHPPERESIDDLWTSYDNFLFKLLPHVSGYVPVDAAPIIQAIALAKLSSLAQAELNIRWRVPIGDTSGIGNRDLSELEPSDRIKAVRKHPVFTEFYGHVEEELVA